MDACCKKKLEIVVELVNRMEELKAKTKQLHDMLESKGLLLDNIKVMKYHVKGEPDGTKNKADRSW